MPTIEETPNLSEDEYALKWLDEKIIVIQALDSMAARIFGEISEYKEKVVIKKCSLKTYNFFQDVYMYERESENFRRFKYR